MHTWPLKSCRVYGARVAYVDVGAGEPTVLLHGYPQCHLAWRHQIGPLSERGRVIAPDWLGWGKSERNLKLAPEYWAEVERLERLRDTLRLSPFNFIAHDYAGYLALGYMHRYGAKVRRLAIINSRAHATFPPGAFHRQVQMIGAMARTPGLRTLAAWLPWDRVHKRGMQHYVKKGCFNDELLDRYVGWMGTAHGRRWFVHFYRHYELGVREEMRGFLREIRCPTAVVWGTHDPFCPVQIAEELAQEIPDATLTRIDGADHYVMEERPDEVLAALTALLSRPFAAAA